MSFNTRSFHFLVFCFVSKFPLAFHVLSFGSWSVLWGLFPGSLLSLSKLSLLLSLLLLPLHLQSFPFISVSCSTQIQSCEMLKKKEVLLSVVAQISPGPLSHSLLTNAPVRCQREVAENPVTCKESRGAETSLTVDTLFSDSGLLLIQLYL